MKKISICVCCYNEEENIELMYEALTNEMKNIPQYDYEIIFEDNDSKDQSQAILRKICEKDTRVKAIFNQTNFGPDRSTVNCMMSISGDAYIGIPCDFQEPPELIHEFIEKWEEGYDIVWGQKTKSKENPIKYMLRNVYYGIINFFSEHKQLKNVIGFGICDRKVIDVILSELKQDPEINIRHAVTQYGFNIELLPYTQKKRERGKSSYSLMRYYSFAITSLCNTSIKPLRYMTLLGMLIGFLSLLVAIVYFIYKMVHWYDFEVGMAPLVIGLFFVSSVQLFCMGILGEYLGILLRKSTDKPIVVEKERINF